MPGDNKKPVVKLVTKDCFGGYRSRSTIDVYVNDELVGTGFYGGEPEGNMRIRDYDWVEDVIARVAKKLGADVSTENHEVEEDEMT